MRNLTQSVILKKGTFREPTFVGVFGIGMAKRYFLVMFCTALSGWLLLQRVRAPKLDEAACGTSSTRALAVRMATAHGTLESHSSTNQSTSRRLSFALHPRPLARAVAAQALHLAIQPRDMGMPPHVAQLFPNAMLCHSKFVSWTRWQPQSTKLQGRSTHGKSLAHACGRSERPRINNERHARA